MSRTISRALTGASILALVVATPASAFAASKHHAPVAKPKHSKPAPARFTVVGTLVSAATDSVTVTVTAGAKDLRTQTVTIAVPSTAKVTRDDVAVTLADLVSGDDVTVVGTRSGTTFTASHVNATSVVAPEPPATETTVTP